MRRLLAIGAIALSLLVMAGSGSTGLAQDKGHVDPNDPPPRPPKSIFDTVVPKATGKNGYEEYAMAADIMRSPALRKALLATNKPQDGITPLASKRALVAAGRRVLALVRVGNQKPIFEPREKLGVMTLFPELSEFKQMSKLFAAEARVRLADGNRAGAVDSIVDCLTFAERIGHYTLIGSLVGIAVSTVALSEVDADLGFYSQRDALTLAKASDDLLQRPLALADAMGSEQILFDSGLDEIFKDGPTALRRSLGKVDDSAPFLDELEKMGPGKVAACKAEATTIMQARWKAHYDRITGPESRWIAPFDPDPQPSTVAQFLVQTLIPDLDGVFSSCAKLRTQLRLLRLHGAIIAFRWENDRLPADLNELGLPGIVADPVLGKPFQYEKLSPGSYKIWSEGWGATGKIELRYQRPPGAVDDEPRLP